MQVNAKVDYAVRAVVEIASSPGRLVRKQELSDAQDIPPRFLENILVQLVRTGLLTATRGAHGGYSLARPASVTTVADIIRAIDGPLAGVRGAPPEQLEYPLSSSHVQEVWVALRASMRAVLEETTVEALVNGRLPPVTRRLLDQPGAWERR